MMVMPVLKLILVKMVNVLGQIPLLVLLVINVKELEHVILIPETVPLEIPWTIFLVMMVMLVLKLILVNMVNVLGKITNVAEPKQLVVYV